MQQAIDNIKAYDALKGIDRNWDFLKSQPDFDKRVLVINANITPGNYDGEPEELKMPEVPTDIPWDEYERRTYGWIDDTVLNGNTYYYAEPRESFNRAEAFAEAKRLRKQYVILEDLS